MAQDQQIIECPDGAWTQLTNADATTFNLRVQKGMGYLRFTTDTTTPTEEKGLFITVLTGIVNRSISDMTGLASADRIWFKAINGPAEVYIDHA